VPKRWLIVGGAGFIGSHLIDHLLADPATEHVTAFDNFVSGRHWHLERHRHEGRLTVVTGDVRDSERLARAMKGHDTVVHLASNPDIARAITDPDVDFVAGTLLTRCVVEAARLGGIRTILYASGSGVYGDLGALEVAEDYGPLIPVSTYGASKLAGEAMIAAYAAMFDMTARAFRFGNVIGSRQTHGVGFDFVRRLIKDPEHLTILGDGTQSKPYVHVDDVVRAVLVAHERALTPFAVFNVATDDYATVREVADITVDALGLDPGSVAYSFTGGARGWKGDVPVVRLNTDRIRALGWRCQHRTHDALRRAAAELVVDARRGRLEPRVD
jgi:UDP-glucose 4-epimerase